MGLEAPEQNQYLYRKNHFLDGAQEFLVKN